MNKQTQQTFGVGMRVLARLPSTAWTESRTEEGVIVGRQNGGRWLVRVKAPGWKAITHDYAEKNLSTLPEGGATASDFAKGGGE